VSTPDAAEVLNLVGFVTGTALYAMLLALVLRRTAPLAAVRGTALPFATAVLGLGWNVGELTAYALPRMGLAENSIALWAASFPALGLLAAVVVHSVARGLPGAAAVTVAAYACSLAASVLHARTVVTGDPSGSGFAFVFLTVSYGVLIVVLSLLTRGRPNGPRALWVLALALFAISASHLGRFHMTGDSWAVELIGHHASIPLAFAILYQDYRFALADLFLKRALTLLALVTIAFGGYSIVSALPPGPFAISMLLWLWVLTALVVPWLHRGIARFVDGLLLGRMDYAALGAEISQSLQSCTTIEQVFAVICPRLASALNAEQVSWAVDPVDDIVVVTTQVTVVTVDPPKYVLRIAQLTGGRRLLSDDHALLQTVATTAARRIDQLRLTTERYEVKLREEEMLKLTAEAELKALRAQINPHFLFNALTTIGYLIEAAPPRAVNTLLQLTALLRGVMRSDGEFTTLGRELDLIQHYLRIEQERFEERLFVRIDVPSHLRSCRIPALVLQPLVENAVKHGIGPSPTGGDVEISAAAVGAGPDRKLRLTVRNSGEPLADVRSPGLDERVGVDNVQRRLAGYFGPRAAFSLTRRDDDHTIAEIIMPLPSEQFEEDDRDAQALAHRVGRR
jgi:hypothetical protein